MDKVILAGYGIFLLVGAFLGWKAGSKISLIMGLISGALVLYGVYLLGTNAKGGYLLLTAVSGLLTAVFIMRFLKTYSFMPSGMLLVASLAVFILVLVKLLK